MVKWSKGSRGGKGRSGQHYKVAGWRFKTAVEGSQAAQDHLEHLQQQGAGEVELLAAEMWLQVVIELLRKREENFNIAAAAEDDAKSKKDGGANGNGGAAGAGGAGAGVLAA